MMGGERRREQGNDRERDRNSTDAKRSNEPLAHHAELLGQRVALGEQMSRPRQNAFSFEREPTKSVSAFDDRHTEAFFEMLEPGGQCRLRHVAGLGGAGK